MESRSDIRDGRASRRALLLPLLALLPVPLLAPLPAGAAPPERLPAGAAVRVAEALDGDTLALADGRQLRLAGIEAARPPPGRETERRWPLAEAARAALNGLARGRDLGLRGLEETPDRYGRLVAHAVRGDGVWLEGALLEAGHARVRTQPHDRALAAEMLAIEDAARTARRGIWGTRAYAVRPAEPASLPRDSFQIVEGRVERAELRGGQVYLDFGADWRSDVTAHLDRDARRLFKRAGLDPLALAGATVRVRGWVSERNGPMIALTHPEQLERLNGPPPATRMAPAPAPALPTAPEETGDGED